MRPAITYRAPEHAELPHLVKFSGGRSSAMMLFTLAEAGALDPTRGDAAVFNNTSAEHPRTYDFVRACRRTLEAEHGIPLFLTEFCTYEDARQGAWRRLATYRLVNDEPLSDSNPGGYRHRGEVFREMVSYKAYLPNQFRRVCTSALKLEVTRRFTEEWLAAKPRTRRRGHGAGHSLVDLDEAYHRHRRAGGTMPEGIFGAKRAYARSASPEREAQAYADYSTAASGFDNPAVAGHVFGGRATARTGAEHVCLVGMRADEPGRVAAMGRRAGRYGEPTEDGEHVYLPLAEWGVEAEDVADYWDGAPFDLGLDAEDNLSNCVHCFLKGPAALRRTADLTDAADRDTPVHIDWWTDIESEYGRDLDAESGGRTSQGAAARVGFFGATGLGYADIAGADDGARLPAWAAQPCVCTN